MNNARQIHQLRGKIVLLRRLRIPLLAGLALCGYVVLRAHVFPPSAGDSPPAPVQVAALTPSVADAPPEAKHDEGKERAFNAPEAPEFWLVNRAENGLRVGFRLNGKVEFLEPGQRLQLAEGPPWRVEFHRGGDGGFADRSLEEGVYEFRVSAEGWTLTPQ